MSKAQSNPQVLLSSSVSEWQERFPTLQRGEVFERFVVHHLLKSLDDREIEAGITDGARDGGIDAGYLFVNRHLVDEDVPLEDFKGGDHIDLHLIQVKSGDGFSTRVLNEMNTTVGALLDLDTTQEEFTLDYNPALSRLAALFRRTLRVLAPSFPSISINIWYVTQAARVPQNIIRQGKSIEKGIAELIPDADVTLRFVGARELLRLARSQSSKPKTLQAAEIPTGSGRALVFLVKLEDYFNFLKLDTGSDGDSEEKDAQPVIDEDLLEANVRAHYTSTPVNQRIKATLEDGGSFDEDFYWLNNGITIVATKMLQSSRLLTLENPKIVNGLQTSMEIFNYFASDRLTFPGKPRHVLVRVIETTDERSRNRIIRSTNDQTRMPPASLRSTDEIHLDIEDYFAAHDLFYERRKNYWLNQNKPAGSIISIPFLAQSYAAVVLQKPGTARGRPSSLVTDESLYASIFGNEDGSPPLRAYLFAVRLMLCVERFAQRPPEHITPSVAGDLKFHVGTLLASKVSGVAKQDPRKLDGDSFRELSEDDIAEAYDIVIRLAREVQRDLSVVENDMDRVAKSTELTDALVAYLRGDDERRERGSQEPLFVPDESAS